MEEADLIPNKKYMFIGCEEVIEYLGKDGNWHQFSKEGKTEVWCEILDSDLRMIKRAGD